MNIKNIGIFSLLFMLVNCSKMPELNVYSLETETLPNAHRQYKSISRYRAKSLKVAYPKSLESIMTDKIKFTYGVQDSGFYLNSSWSENLGKLLQGFVVKNLSNSKNFKVVIFDDTMLQEGYRLESTVFSFYHSVESINSYSIVEIEFYFIDASDGGLIKNRKFKYKELCQTVDAKGYALATNIVMSKLAKELKIWLQ